MINQSKVTSTIEKGLELSTSSITINSSIENTENEFREISQEDTRRYRHEVFIFQKLDFSEKRVFRGPSVQGGRLNTS